MTGAIQRGFTIIELMLVVTLMGIMAAIAIPSFMRFTYRARIAELPTNVQAIKTAMLQYHGARARFDPLDPAPTACLEGVGPGDGVLCHWAFPWDPDGDDRDAFGYSGVGWIPEGPLWGEYAAVTACPGVNATDQCFTVESRVDIDNDGEDARFTYAHPDRAGDFALGVNFGGSVPPVDENGDPRVGVVFKDFLGDNY